MPGYPRQHTNSKPRLTQLNIPLSPEHYEKLEKLVELRSEQFGITLTKSAILDVLINQYLEHDEVVEVAEQRLAVVKKGRHTK
jgi:predicted DNA-binding protein